MSTLLSRLHYDPKWLEYGFLDQAFLHEQIAQYETSDDKNTEHYRYAAFRKLLDSSAIDDSMIDCYIELAELDEDQSMANAALGLLIRHEDLRRIS